MKYSMPKHIAVAIAGGVLAVSLGAGVIFLAQGSENDPADILPAAQTLALVRNADRGSMLTLQTYVTGFDSIALPDHPVDVALLALPGGSPAWAIFDAKAAPVGMRFSISASDASVQGMIGEGEGRLSEEKSYEEMKGYLRDGPAAYLTFPGVGMKPSAASTVFAPTKPVAVQLKANAIRIVLPEGDLPASLGSVLSPSARTLAQSRIRTVATSLFGSALSPAYDIWPLVKRDTNIRLAGDSFSVAGKTDTPVSVRDGIKKLHDSFASAKAGVEVVELPLDDQFSYTGVRLSDDAATRTSESKNGFTVETSTRNGTNGSLVTATQGSSVVLSDTQDGLNKGMEALSGSGSGFDFTLSADEAALRRFFPDAKGAIRWNVDREGNRLILTIPR